jgi:hypothetical protein
MVATIQHRWSPFLVDCPCGQRLMTCNDQWECECGRYWQFEGWAIERDELLGGRARDHQSGWLTCFSALSATAKVEFGTVVHRVSAVLRASEVKRDNASQHAVC